MDGWMDGWMSVWCGGRGEEKRGFRGFDEGFTKF